MKIDISESVKGSLTDDEYKFLLLLEFNKKFNSMIIPARRRLGYTIPEKPNGFEEEKIILYDPKWKSPDTLPSRQLLLSVIADIMNEVQIPWTLYNPIEQLILLGGTITTTSPPAVVYNLDDFMIRSKITSETFPVIELHKRMPKKAFYDYLKAMWPLINKAMARFENRSNILVKLGHINIREIEQSILIYRYRNNKISFRDIAYDLKIEETTARKYHSRLHKVLENINFI